MMAARGYGMQTFTAQMQVTGKRHFGKKALPAGGGGGKLPTRELFDTLLFWQANVALDAQGEASVEIPLNDSLTSFRIVAIAASENRFGTGKTAIRSSQDSATDLRPVAGGARRRPPASLFQRAQRQRTRHEDRSERRRQGPARLAARARSTWPPAKRAKSSGRWSCRRATSLEWTLSAQAVDGKEPGKLAHDALKVKQAIHAAVPVRVQSASLYRLEHALELPVAAPHGSLPGSGELRATLSASLADGQTGLRDYMRRYPYACLEQKVSKAVAHAGPRRLGRACRQPADLSGR